jgi:hypothetical protein
MVYGAIAISEEVGVEIYAAKRVPHSWADKDASKWTQRVSSRYCSCPADSSSWQTYANVIDKTIVQPARAKGGARKE